MPHLIHRYLWYLHQVFANQRFVFCRSQLLGSHQSAVEHVQQRTSTVAHWCGARQAALRSIPATAAHWQAQGKSSVPQTQRKGHSLTPSLALSLSPCRPLALSPSISVWLSSSTGFRHAAQHGSITRLSRGQGHKAAREHIRRSFGLSLPIRGDLHTLRHREQSRLRALHTGLQFSGRGRSIKRRQQDGQTNQSY